MITSTQNQKIKWVRMLQSSSRARRKEGVFVIEGIRLAEEALAANWNPNLVLYTEDLDERGQAVLQGFSELHPTTLAVAPHVMKAASDTQTPQGLLVVLEHREVSIPDDLDFVFIPDQMRDPGNLGTMLRTACAAGVQAVLVPPGVVDPFAPKVVRAGMGAHFRLPIRELTWKEIRAKVKQLNTYLAAARQGLPYTSADLRAPLALIIGGEADGASSEASSLAIDKLHIPMLGSSESLNAAIAAGILLFEVVRQRMGHS